jgi:hypothetical protein
LKSYGVYQIATVKWNALIVALVKLSACYQRLRLVDAVHPADSPERDKPASSALDAQR